MLNIDELKNIRRDDFPDAVSPQIMIRFDCAHCTKPAKVWIPMPLRQDQEDILAPCQICSKYQWISFFKGEDNGV